MNEIMTVPHSVIAGEQQMRAGYRSVEYASALHHLGTPRAIDACGAWLLERSVPDNDARDAIGCYPLFCCADWSRLADDLAALASSGIVSVVLVADPFGNWTTEMLRDCFPDLCRPFKRHYVCDLTSSPEQFVHVHHRRNVRKALQCVEVERCESAVEHLGDWVRLYGILGERHGIEGLADFSRESFRGQLAAPGMVAFRAVANGTTVGMLLWFVQNGVAYYHLGAYDNEGYRCRASFALFWKSIEQFRAAGVRWLDLGGTAGVHDADDGLARFKRGWSSGSRTAYLCGRVLDRERYDALVHAAGGGRADGNGFFPAYRAV